ncbi:cytochrome b-c1 complex subunit 8 [Rhodofomes roseus]|uniref:Cytochrome b-c1 complex subunit 8 n=1 Tax=Rhodofomes roseus TaxID=34475 RepID=A0ABQ8JZ38_9APHY|nr:cytochrome b-c1 complex subunit 8 [Rhodofomes roseus]KAH9829569.1 cytochrome b-c1 complex subunit 8 [Rhodofomes roseus]
MRATEIRRSDMPGPKVYNLWWGDKELPKQKGVIQYSMSPMRQRATHHIFRNWIFNGYRRLSGQVGYWIIPVAIGYGTYAWAKRYDAFHNSKAGHLAAHGGH